MSAADIDQTGDTAHLVRKRSVRIAGHRTSVSLEDAFWNELTRIAGQRGQSVNAVIAAIDAGRGGNLSSAVRVFILNEVRQANGPSEPPPRATTSED